jgi:hypothetical protein
MDWREIWKANPNVKNPDKIYAGQALSIPDKGASQAPAGSLEKTLPSAVPAAQSPSLPGAAPNLTGNQLPAAARIGQMSLLRRVLSKLSTNYQASGMKAGLQETMSGLENSAGFSPEKVSGNMVGSIVDFVEGQVRKPIENEVQTFADAIDSIAKIDQETNAQKEKLADNARQMISQAISGNMWNAMDDNQRKSLWTAAGYAGEPVTAKDTNTAAYHTTDADGNVINVVYDKSTGAIISQESLGQIGKGTTKKVVDEDPEITSFKKDAADLIAKLDSGDGKTTWKTAWDTLHLKYPTAPVDIIDAALGLERRAAFEGK